MRARFRLSAIIGALTIVAVLLAFWRLKPRGEFLAVVPWSLLTLVLAIILATLAFMLNGPRQKR